MSPTSILRGIAFLLLLQWVSTLIIKCLRRTLSTGAFGNADFDRPTMRWHHP